MASNTVLDLVFCLEDEAGGVEGDFVTLVDPVVLAVRLVLAGVVLPNEILLNF
jgi:hypothetical protein